MQLEQFYLSILQMTLIDALALGAGAAMLASTFLGIKLKRMDIDAFSKLLGGTIAIVFGTIFGYYVMNTVGYLIAWSGAPIQGLAGADLTEWTSSLAALFAPYQMQAAGFAIMGALFGIGWGYGIGARPEDNSLLGNLLTTLGVIAIFMGLLFTILQTFVALAVADAFWYLVLFNGLILLCYGIGAAVNHYREDSSEVVLESIEDEVVT
jgi:hypothetical protein